MWLWQLHRCQLHRHRQHHLRRLHHLPIDAVRSTAVCARPGHDLQQLRDVHLRRPRGKAGVRGGQGLPALAAGQLLQGTQGQQGKRTDSAFDVRLFKFYLMFCPTAHARRYRARSLTAARSFRRPLTGDITGRTPPPVRPSTRFATRASAIPRDTKSKVDGRSVDGDNLYR